MLAFNQGGKGLFELFIQMKPNGDPTNMFPSDYNLPSQMKKVISTLCFPLAQNEYSKWEATTYINHFEDPLHPNIESYYYIYIRYNVKPEGVMASCIVSRYLYPTLFFYILQICSEKPESNILSSYFNATLEKTNFDTIIVNGQDNKLPIYDGLSDQCQIAYFHKFFISNFPSYYIPLLMSLLFFESRIIVCSSSFKLLSHTILSICSFFYPLKIHVFAAPLVTVRDIERIPSDGLAVVGVHTTMLNKIFCSQDFNQNYIFFNADEPYITNKSKIAIPDRLYTEMDKFALDITNLCLNTQPAFPAPFILKRIQAFVAQMIGIVFEIPQIDFQRVFSAFSKRVNKNDKTSDFVLARSTLLKLLIEQSSQEEIKSAFWEDVSGEIEMFGRTKSLSIRRVPIPKQSIDVTKKKSKQSHKGKK
ncbi:hypothetical protein TRFO_13092 [Tritrichomonas foetus]|uniref:UDENN domain-containing protein n=1 Tax=Tritrichomonas foetus TaxID=1144522 RepID=A0A1J4KZH3_9EUKA|nr:hypothetical protein TRFO_13092 [Tritrichomonas foetus]|eukprot:OHT16657.1 hypothetical protein TRFO_13092 [Tritrichomonas foetus]